MFGKTEGVLAWDKIQGILGRLGRLFMICIIHPFFEYFYAAHNGKFHTRIQKYNDKM